MIEPNNEVDNQEDDRLNAIKKVLKDLTDKHSALNTEMLDIIGANEQYKKKLEDSQNTIKELRNELKRVEKQKTDSINHKQLMSLIEEKYDKFASQHNYTLLCTFLAASTAAAAIALCVSKHSNK